MSLQSIYHCFFAFQMVLHDMEDVPMIRNLGFAISPGVHALVGVKHSLVSKNICRAKLKLQPS